MSKPITVNANVINCMTVTKNRELFCCLQLNIWPFQTNKLTLVATLRECTELLLHVEDGVSERKIHFCGMKGINSLKDAVNSDSGVLFTLDQSSFVKLAITTLSAEQLLLMIDFIDCMLSP